MYINIVGLQKYNTSLTRTYIHYDMIMNVF